VTAQLDVGQKESSADLRRSRENETLLISSDSLFSFNKTFDLIDLCRSTGLVSHLDRNVERADPSRLRLVCFLLVGDGRATTLFSSGTYTER